MPLSRLSGLTLTLPSMAKGQDLTVLPFASLTADSFLRLCRTLRGHVRLLAWCWFQHLLHVVLGWLGVRIDALRKFLAFDDHLDLAGIDHLAHQQCGGNLFGTAESGGLHGNGVVFKITPN